MLCSAHQLPLSACLANTALLTRPSCTGNTYPLQTCLENSELLGLSSCSYQFPLQTCLDNSDLLGLPSCSYQFPLETCVENSELFSEEVQCGSQLSPEVCATVPSLTLGPQCRDLLVGYQPSLFQCSDNKEALCSLDLCGKHQFIVKC